MARGMSTRNRTRAAAGRTDRHRRPTPQSAQRRPLEEFLKGSCLLLDADARALAGAAHHRAVGVVLEAFARARCSVRRRTWLGGLVASTPPAPAPASARRTPQSTRRCRDCRCATRTRRSTRRGFGFEGARRCRTSARPRRRGQFARAHARPRGPPAAAPAPPEPAAHPRRRSRAENGVKLRSESSGREPRAHDSRRPLDCARSARTRRHRNSRTTRGSRPRSNRHRAPRSWRQVARRAGGRSAAAWRRRGHRRACHHGGTPAWHENSGVALGCLVALDHLVASRADVEDLQTRSTRRNVNAALQHREREPS